MEIQFGKKKVLVTQLCPTLCDPMDFSPPGSSVHGIFQARILEWIAISFSRVSSQPRDWTWVSCITGSFFLLSEPHTGDTHKCYVLKILHVPYLQLLWFIYISASSNSRISALVWLSCYWSFRTQLWGCDARNLFLILLSVCFHSNRYTALSEHQSLYFVRSVSSWVLW